MYKNRHHSFSRNKLLLFVAALFSFGIMFQSVAIAQSNEQSPDSVSIAKPLPVQAEMTKSPTGALLRSFAIPGWGQLYVESYWKAPIFFAGAGTLVYFIVSNNSDFVKYNDEYNALSDKYSLEGLTLKNKKEYYRDNRDMSAFYLLAVYALSAIDAYVDAHLFDFSVDKDLNMYISNKQNGFALNLQYRIK